MDKRQKALLETAEQLVDNGFQIAPIGSGKALALKKGEYGKTLPADLTAKALDMIEASKVTGMRIELGKRGAIPQDDGTVLVPLAIEREGKATKAYRSRFMDAIARLGVTETWAKLKDRDSGFIQDTGGGGRRWFFLIRLDSVEDLAAVLARAESHVAHERELDDEGNPAFVDKNGKYVSEAEGKPSFLTVAELLTDHAIAAPSYGRVHSSGDPYVFYTECDPALMPTLTADEIALLGAVLAETTEGSIARKGETSIVRLSGRMTQRTRDVSRLYNASATDAQAIELLEGAGWTIHSGEPGVSDEVFLSRPGAKTGGVDAKVGGGEREGGVYVYSTSDDALESGYHPPFELYARLTHEAKASDAADALLSDGVVELPTLGGASVLQATNRVEVEMHTMHGVAIQDTIVSALAAAENPRDAETPLVLAKIDAHGDHKVQYILTPIPGVAPVKWSRIDELHALLYAAAQPCVKKYKDGEVVSVKYTHNIPSGVVRGVFTHLMNTPGVLPSVKVVAAEPVLIRAKDGSLSVEQTSGFHKETGVLLTIPHADREFWAEGYRVSENPTRAQAQSAADYLLGEVFLDFPFASAGDRARALAYLLTIIARHTLPTVPAWLFDAADRGSGKTKLGETCRMIAGGSTKAVEVSPDKRADDETEKKVVSAIIAGTNHIHVDEVPRGSSITSTVLTKIVTANPGSISFRVLGGNDTMPIEGLTVTFAGNNVNIGGDFNRRTFPIRMEFTGNIAAHERTGFRHIDLLGWVSENRPTLLAAAHTILLYGSQHPTKVPGVGSFEKWSQMILGSLSHVTMDDQTITEHVMEGRSEWTAENDSMVDDWGQFFAWFAENFERPTEIKAVRAKLNEMRKVGVEVELPPELFAQPGEMEQTVNRRWSDALRDMRSTNVILDGNTYKLSVENRGKKAARYVVARSEYGEASPQAARKAIDVSPSSFLPDAPVARVAAAAPVASMELDFS